MKTAHLLIVYIIVAIYCSATVTSDVIEFPEMFDPWESAVPNYVTLNFTGIDKPGLTSVTNQYHELGIYFPDWNELLQSGKGAYVNDGWGVRGYFLPPGEIHAVFDVPRNAIAVHFPGCIFIDLYSDGQLIHSGTGDCGDAEQGFIGLISDVAFNEVWLCDDSGSPEVDDIYASVPYIAGDLTGDAWVGPADLGQLLASWGPCPPPPPEGNLCLADVFPAEGADGVGDGMVNAGDLATLLANWSRDCNGNDRADSLDLTLDGDCNANGLPDDCDIALGHSEDCNANATPDECDFVQRVPSYAHDDGTQETAFGTNQTDLVWMSAFTVQKGAETIVAVEISWGYGPADIAIWDDPNNDGNPEDAKLLIVVENELVRFPDHDPFRVIEVPATYVGEAGERFFMGAHVVTPGAAGSDEFPAGFDESASAGQSWVTAGTVDKFDPPFLMDGAGYPGNWMIRAVTEQSADVNKNGELDACE